MINKLKYIALSLLFCFLLSQDSFNANLVGHWFAPNENYWSENISDFNDIWGYEDEDGNHVHHHHHHHHHHHGAKITPKSLAKAGKGNVKKKNGLEKKRTFKSVGVV